MLVQALELTDRYGRRVEVVRITVTHRCNFHCFFCHFEGEQNEVKDLLTPEDFGILAEAFSKFGIKKFKLTGGEPTIREDIVKIVSEIKIHAKPQDLSMTTNGYLLEKLAGKLREAGLVRLNVSLHTLNKEKYKIITGVDGLENVVRGLFVARDLGYKKIKINVVILKGINERDIWDIINFASKHEFNVQLIELHPVGKGANVFNKYYTPLSAIEEKLKERASKVLIRDLQNRPVYVLDNGFHVEIVRPVQNPIFCAECRRLRVTAKGELKPCLVRNDNLVPVFNILRKNIPRKEKVKQLTRAIIAANALREPSSLWYFNRDFELFYLNNILKSKSNHNSFRIKNVNFKKYIGNG